MSTILAPYDHGKRAYDALQTSLRDLDCGYIDLYLIHWPGTFLYSGPRMTSRKLRDESWQQMIKGVNDGLSRNIGVSNYNVRQLRELLDNNHGIKPAVNQVRKLFFKKLIKTLYLNKSKNNKQITRLPRKCPLYLLRYFIILHHVERTSRYELF